MIWCGIFASYQMADEQDSDDGDEIKLSASTLAALHEFYAERALVQQEAQCQQGNYSSDVTMPAEDWVIAVLWLLVVN